MTRENEMRRKPTDFTWKDRICFYMLLAVSFVVTYALVSIVFELLRGLYRGLFT
jgi:hypothetical protein